MCVYKLSLQIKKQIDVGTHAKKEFHFPAAADKHFFVMGMVIAVLLFGAFLNGICYICITVERRPPPEIVMKSVIYKRWFYLLCIRYLRLVHLNGYNYIICNGTFLRNQKVNVPVETVT